MSMDAKDQVKVDGKVHVQNRTNSVQHLDRDPNDPRRNVAAKPNLSNLDKEDPEQKPKPQNPVE